MKLFTTFEKMEINKLYQDGLSLTKLSEKFITNRERIKKILLENNTSLRTFEEAVNQFIYDKRELEELYLIQKLSILKIANKLNIGYRAIRNALLREQIPLRKSSTKGLHNHSKETRRKISERMKGNNNPMKILRTNSGSFKKGEKHRYYGKTYEEIYGEKKTKEIKNKTKQTRIEKGLSKGNKNPMKNPENVKKWIKSNHIKPNKKELELFDILNRILPNEYNINVEGNILILDGKIPDFVNINGKRKLIEHFGDYWHKDENPNERIDLFKPFGYDTLVIWESELKDKAKLKDKIEVFNKI